jgi:PIN domain nuclease of toxin-antitoxin system
MISGDERLPPDTRTTLVDPDTEVWLSVVSIWEVCVKQSIGRLALPAPAWTYVTNARERHGIESLALTEAAIEHLSKLPEVHKDPFDRILVCQAVEHDLLLVTNDPFVRRYPVKTFWR